MPPGTARASLQVDKEVSGMTSGDVPRPLPGKRRRVALLPTTRLGKWAAGLAAASIVLNLGWRLMGPLGGFPSLVCGLAGGIVALVAILRRGERSIAAYAALVIFLNVVVFVLAELLVGHD